MSKIVSKFSSTFNVNNNILILSFMKTGLIIYKYLIKVAIVVFLQKLTTLYNADANENLDFMLKSKKRNPLVKIANYRSK